MKSAKRVRDIAVLLLAIFWSVATLAGEVKKSIVVSDIGLATPESVEYYAAEDLYLVTNINGSPFAADGNGFISKIKPDGSVVKLKWIDGEMKGVTLHSPKGAAIVGNNLYVADINQVHVFALPSGKQKKSITIKGSTFLNGITPGGGNSVYVTDSGYNEGFKPNGTDAVYKVWANGKYKTIIKNKNMEHPNGILKEKERLVLVPFGSGKIISIDNKGKMAVMQTAPSGGLDGLVSLKDGRYLISSWGSSSIYVMNESGKFNVLADSLDAPADLGVDTKRNRVLVPLFKQNKVVFLPF